MNDKVIIVATTHSNLLKAIIKYMECEKVEYFVQKNLLKIETNVKKLFILKMITKKLIKDKLFGREKEREKYFDVSKDLYKKALLKTILLTN